MTKNQPITVLVLLVLHPTETGLPRIGWSTRGRKTTFSDPSLASTTDFNCFKNCFRNWREMADRK